MANVHEEFEMDRLRSEVKRLSEALDKEKLALSNLEALMDSPEIESFTEGLVLEAAHQERRWGKSYDRSKSAEHWFWLVGHLSGKALRASIEGDKAKALHHTISSAAALFKWHLAIKADESGSGVGADIDVDPEARGAIEEYKTALTEAGFVIVPREPTEKMAEVGQAELMKDDDCTAFDRHWAGIFDMWRAMVAEAKK